MCLRIPHAMPVSAPLNRKSCVIPLWLALPTSPRSDVRPLLPSVYLSSSLLTFCPVSASAVLTISVALDLSMCSIMNFPSPFSSVY